MATDAETDSELQAVKQFAGQIGRGPGSSSPPPGDDARTSQLISEWNPYPQLLAVEQQVGSTWDQPLGLNEPIGKLDLIRNSPGVSDQVRDRCDVLLNFLIDYRKLAPDIQLVNDILSEARALTSNNQASQLPALKAKFDQAMKKFEPAKEEYVRRQKDESIQIWAQFEFQSTAIRAISQAVTAVRAHDLSEIDGPKQMIARLQSGSRLPEREADRLLLQRLARLNVVLNNPKSDPGDVLLVLFVTEDFKNMLNNRTNIQSTLERVVNQNLTHVIGKSIILISRSGIPSPWNPSERFPGDLIPFDEDASLANVFGMGVNAIEDTILEYLKPPRCTIFLWASVWPPESYPGPPNTGLGINPADKIICCWIGSTKEPSPLLNRWFDRKEFGCVNLLRQDETDELSRIIGAELK